MAKLKIQWDDPLDLEQRVAYLVREMEIYGVSFDLKKAERQVRKLSGVQDRLYIKIRPYLTYYVNCLETKYSGETKSFKVDNYNCYMLKKGDVQFVKKIRNKIGTYSQSACMFYDPSLLGGPYSRIELVEPKLSQRLKLTEQLIINGWKPKERTDKGTPQLTIKGEPVKSLHKLGPFGRSLSDWYICNHRKGQIEGFINSIREDGRLKPGCNPCGTNTFRARHSIIANLPRGTSFWGKCSRSLMKSSDGYSMVGADLSGLELRCLAHRMNNAEYTDLVLNGDPHTYNMNILGLPTRDDAKTWIYAFIYGASDKKLGSIAGGSSEDGRDMRYAILSEIPSLAKLIDKVQAFGSRYGWLPALDRRKVYIRKMDGRLLIHTALNTLLQSDGAIIAKRAMLITYDEIKERGLDAHQLIYYHDEYQYEAIYGIEKEVGQIMVDSMEYSGIYYNMKIPIEGEYKIGRNWSHTH